MMQPPIYLSKKMAADSAAGDTVAETNFGGVMQDCEIVGCWIIPDGAVTAHASNYATITVAVDGTTIEAFVTTSGGTGNWVDNTEVLGTLDKKFVTASKKTPARFAVTVAKAASGVQLPSYTIMLALLPTAWLAPNPS